MSASARSFWKRAIRNVECTWCLWPEHVTPRRAHKHIQLRPVDLQRSGQQRGQLFGGPALAALDLTQGKDRTAGAFGQLRLSQIETLPAALGPVAEVDGRFLCANLPTAAL